MSILDQYSNEPLPPQHHVVAVSSDAFRYTNVNQAQWFFDRINMAFGSTTPNVRMEGTTIRWFGYYWLNLGDWLYQGMTPVTDEVMRASYLRPVGNDWPPDPGLDWVPGDPVPGEDTPAEPEVPEEPAEPDQPDGGSGLGGA